MNTYDVEAREEDLGTATDLATWLVDRGLLPAGRRLNDRDLATARAFRDALRDVLAPMPDMGTWPPPDDTSTGSPPATPCACG